MKEQGVLNPEEYVLNQYIMPDPTKPPVPIDTDDSLAAGVLMLYPESVQEKTGVAPTVGGFVGTVKSIFRVLGLDIPVAEEKPQSEEVARSKRKGGRTGLYGDKIK